MKCINKVSTREYVKPVCKSFALEWQPMMAGSVKGAMDNKDVAEDPDNPWNTNQDKQIRTFDLFVVAILYNIARGDIEL